MTFNARHIYTANICVILSCGWLLGCSFGEVQQLPTTELTVGGVARTYHLFVPATPPEAPMPLLVAVHGGGGEGFAFPQQDQFEALAEQQGVIIALPQSKQLPENEGEWQLNTTAETHQDIDFIEAMIDDIAATHDIDPTRIYATESQTDFATSRHIVHDSCAQNVRVEHHRLNEVGHEWPDSIDGTPTPNVIWSFVSSFSKFP